MSLVSDRLRIMNVEIFSGAGDPSAGGAAAPLGSLYLRENGEEWLKKTGADTGWSINGTGNATIPNLDKGDLVRYNFWPQINPIAGAVETTAMYARLGGGFGPSIPQYGIYIEIPTTQNYTTGGSATKVIHEGHGDAHYVALLNGITAKTISAMTGNLISPIVVTIVGHGFGQGDIVQITGALGNTAANGVWYGITILTADTFSLPASTGNGPYTANSGSEQDIDSPVGYEAAAYGDGTVGFLSSMQQKGGRANWIGFEELYQQNMLLNYAAFNALAIPNKAFSVTKQAGLGDSAIDGYTQYELLEASPRLLNGNGVAGGNYTGGWAATTAYVVNDTVTLGAATYACILGNTNQTPPNATYWTNVTDAPNNNRLRIGLYNSGLIVQAGLKARAALTLVDSPEHRLRGTYWNGASSADMDAVFKLSVTAVTPAAELRLYLGPTATPQLSMIVRPHAGAGGDLDLQGGALSNILSITGSMTNIQTAGVQFDHYVNGAIHAEYGAPADTETALLIRRNVAGVFSLQRVSMGAVDSGGVGFKVLRVPN